MRMPCAYHAHNFSTKLDYNRGPRETVGSLGFLSAPCGDLRTSPSLLKVLVKTLPGNNSLHKWQHCHLRGALL